MITARSRWCARVRTGAWLGLLLALALPARAEEQLALRLSPDPDALHRARTEALEQRLVKLLTALPDVERAEVQLELPAAFREPLDAPLPKPSATVVLRRRGQGPSAEDIFRVLHGSVSELPRERLTLVERDVSERSVNPAATSFVQVGPFRVHPSSAPGLRLCFAISLLANVLLAAIVLSRPRRK